MVVKMMKWRPWPPLSSKKFEARLVLGRLEGLDSMVLGNGEKDLTKLTVEIKWKGSKTVSLSSLRRSSVKRNLTKHGALKDNGIVEWNEEFQSLCNFLAYNRDTLFHPWEVIFTVFNGSNPGLKNKISVVGAASLNLAEFAFAAEEKEMELSVPLRLSTANTECNPSLCLSISLLELRTAQEPSDTVNQRCIMPVLLSPSTGEALSRDKDELSALKAGLRKVKIFKEYVSSQRAKKACREEGSSDGRCSVRSEDAEYNYPLDTDSPDDFEEGESEESKDCKEDSSLPKPFTYETLSCANFSGGSLYSNTISSAEDGDWIYYSNRKSDVGCPHVENSTASASEKSSRQSSKRRILSWRKRKLSFRSPKAKGEPLLKKHYGEEGGDDIDFDRRQLSSSDDSSFGGRRAEDDSITNRSSVSEFGDDNFAVGSWEQKELISRDGHMKLQTRVFFASIDQRSERAAGESACTALVAVIADWLQCNPGEMPIKSQFDSLIREGSSEWRNLCENEAYMDRFPDKHFDLETVLHAEIRPLSVAPEKSFIGFFHPEGLDEGPFDFLHGAMSFDSIWDEISRFGSDSSAGSNPQVYIVSWNDHFFVLKVEQDAYYIIDTLGERLYEGCSQAYVLKFDKDTTIQLLPIETQESDVKPATDKAQLDNSEAALADTSESESSEKAAAAVVCGGKESCKEYIKSFLAAIPIRELQTDIKKGLMASTPLHHRLQIEFHYTQFLQQVAESSTSQGTGETAVPVVAQE